MATFATTNVTVTTAGTRVQVSSTDLWVKKAVLAGHAANTGHIYVGTSSVSSTVGLQLKVGAPPVVLGDLESAGYEEKFNLKDMWIDSSVNGEKLSILYFQ